MSSLTVNWIEYVPWVYVCIQGVITITVSIMGVKYVRSEFLLQKERMEQQQELQSFSVEPPNVKEKLSNDNNEEEKDVKVAGTDNNTEIKSELKVNDGILAEASATSADIDVFTSATDANNPDSEKEVEIEKELKANDETLNDEVISIDDTDPKIDETIESQENIANVAGIENNANQKEIDDEENGEKENISLPQGTALENIDDTTVKVQSATQNETFQKQDQHSLEDPQYQV